MNTRHRFAVLILLVLGGCGGPEVAGPPAAPPPEASVLSLNARFERAYYKVACMANAGRDPEMTITPLRKPVEYLEGLAEKKDPKLNRAMRILLDEGFPSLDDFRAVEQRMRQDREFWARLESRFIDELKACK
jgi:hypothetical protein